MIKKSCIFASPIRVNPPPSQRHNGCVQKPVQRPVPRRPTGGNNDIENNKTYTYETAKNINRADGSPVAIRRPCPSVCQRLHLLNLSGLLLVHRLDGNRDHLAARLRRITAHRPAIHLPLRAGERLHRDGVAQRPDNHRQLRPLLRRLLSPLPRPTRCW